MMRHSYEAIEKGIANHDIEGLREAIGSICYTNRTLSNGEFFEAITYVEKKGIKLKDDKLIGEPIISDQKKEFTDDDYARAVFELKKNFCDERIKDVQTIGKKLYGKKTTPITTTKPSNPAGKVPNQECHQRSQKSVVISGLVAVVIVLVLILILLKLK